MNDCPNCEYHRQRAQLWRDEAYKQAGHPLPEREQKPVAWIYKGEKSFDGNKYSDEYELTASKQVALWKDKDAKPLYTTPPQRTWVALTNDDYAEIKQRLGIHEWPYAVAAKLKEKNT